MQVRFLIPGLPSRKVGGVRQKLMIEALREVEDPNLPSSGIPQTVLNALYDAGFKLQATQITTAADREEEEMNPLEALLGRSRR